MNITPYAIAKKIGKPPQVVYKRIDSILKNPPVDNIGEHIKKENSNWLITEKGENIIISSFDNEQQIGQRSEHQYSLLNNKIINLKELLKAEQDKNAVLQEKLDSEREETKNKLFEQNERILTLVENQQVLMRIEQTKANPLLSENVGSQKKQSLLNRIFGKHKHEI